MWNWGIKNLLLMEKLVLTFSQIAGGENCFVKTRAKEQSPYIYPYQYTNEKKRK